MFYPFDNRRYPVHATGLRGHSNPQTEDAKGRRGWCSAFTAAEWSSPIWRGTRSAIVGRVTIRHAWPQKDTLPRKKRIAGNIWLAGSEEVDPDCRPEADHGRRYQYNCGSDRLQTAQPPERMCEWRRPQLRSRHGCTAHGPVRTRPDCVLRYRGPGPERPATPLHTIWQQKNSTIWS